MNDATTNDLAPNDLAINNDTVNDNTVNDAVSNDPAAEKLVKVVLVQQYEDGDESDVEMPWALELGNHQYQLKNFPFFFYGLSYNDTFEAKPLPEQTEDERPHFIKLIEKSGHRTVRIFLKKTIKESKGAQKALDELKAMGCGYEGNGKRFFAVNIQPHCDFDAVMDFIKNSKHIDAWEMADPVDDESAETDQ